MGRLLALFALLPALLVLLALPLAGEASASPGHEAHGGHGAGHHAGAQSVEPPADQGALLFAAWRDHCPSGQQSPDCPEASHCAPSGSFLKAQPAAEGAEAHGRMPWRLTSARSPAALAPPIDLPPPRPA